MQQYVDYLLEDLATIAKNPPAPPHYDVPEELEGIEYVLEWENNPYQTMLSLFNLEPEVFPPADRLSVQQLEQLNVGILELWAAHNFYADFPEDVPSKRLYEVLVDYMQNAECQYISEGSSHVEFCQYEPDNCPWGNELCSCKDWVNEINEANDIWEEYQSKKEYGEEEDDDALPF